MKKLSPSFLLFGAAMAAGFASAPAWAQVEPVRPPARPVFLVATVTPTQGHEVRGTVIFTDLGDNIVSIIAEVDGLEPNSRHGFHVHEFGDLSDPKGESAGGHFNPEGHDHALPGEAPRHAGDLGNLVADGNGSASLELKVSNLTLDAGPYGILGRSVVIHERADDGGQPAGNAGGRIGVGVIGFQDPVFSLRFHPAADDPSVKVTKITTGPDGTVTTVRTSNDAEVITVDRYVEPQRPLERAGEATGQALERAGDATGRALRKAGRATGNALEKAGEATGKAVEKTGEALEKVGRKIGEALR